jgi:hypothetical protein
MQLSGSVTFDTPTVINPRRMREGFGMCVCVCITALPATDAVSMSQTQ